MVKALKQFSWLPCGVLALVLAACGGDSGGGADAPGGVVWGSPLDPTVHIHWGPRLDMSELSPLAGAEADFSPDVIDALARAAQAIPNGASQSSRVDTSGQTTDEIEVKVVYNDKAQKQVYELTEGSQKVQVPSSPPGQVSGLALFSTLLPDIEPDLSSYHHELLGIWAWDGQVGTFWSRSPPLVDPFKAAFPSGSATYEGDAVGLHAADGATSKFLAKVKLDANFDNFKVSGTVNDFRLHNGNTLDNFTVNLGETEFAQQGKPFHGNTTAANVAAGHGTWGGRWSDVTAGGIGGTFGFAADDKSVAVLGAFTAVIPPSSSSGGNDDDSVTSRN